MKKFLICIISLISVISVACIINHYFPFVRFYKNTPEFNDGERWVCSSPYVNVEVIDGVPVGYMEINGETLKISCYFKANTIYFLDKDSEMIMLGDCNTMNDEKIKIKNIQFIDESLKKETFKQIVLIKNQ